MSILAIGLALFCYSAVSPRTLPTVAYNMKFYENIKIVALAMIAPIFYFMSVFDPKENNLNNLVSVWLVDYLQNLPRPLCNIYYLLHHKPGECFL